LEGIAVSDDYQTSNIKYFEDIARNGVGLDQLMGRDPHGYSQIRIESQHSASSMHFGAKSEAVRTLQADLAALGYTDNRGSVLRIDGHYGPSTEAAVRAFQSDQGLHNDGVAGKHTLQAMQVQRALLSVVPAFAPELDGRLSAQPGHSRQESSFAQRLDRMLAAADAGDWRQFDQDAKAMANMAPGRQMWAHTVQLAGMEDRLVAQHQQHSQEMQQMQHAMQQQSMNQGRVMGR
jgi:hypothetical protein